MALNGDVMGDAVLAAIDSLSDSEKESRQELFRAMCGAIVSHIKTNAQVTTNVAVASVSGVSPGPGVSGPGTGTGTGTIL